VRAGTDVHVVAIEALDGGDRTAHDAASLDDLDVEAGSGQIAGSVQRVVASTDDDDVSHGDPV
jgi:hypothetical protein